MAEIGADGGWAESARGWVNVIDAGEPHRELLLDAVMLDLCGDVSGLHALDIGCGEGRFCRLLSQRGAISVGLDPITELVGAAITREPGGRYLQASGETLPFASERFDLIVSYLSLIDITDFRSAISEAARVLRGGGKLLVANLGFVTASLGWARDDAGNRLYHRIDRYAEESPQVVEWSGIRIKNWHRPLSAYMEAYLKAGLQLRAFLEPVPKDDSLLADPRFEDWYRVPLFNVMLWEKSA
ncbi:MAG TPA: class I SAM-dependent methyltransferase [Dehalococcoidia bacterium]|nr:class I SAM-dependent methyltransferase [Dehalococcoidia bacterium]